MNAIRTAFLHLWAFLTGLGAKELNYIENHVVPVLHKDAGQALIALAPTALSIVQTLATTGTVSNEKRDAAVAQLRQVAITTSINAATSVLNDAVENAVQELKARQGASGAASMSSSTVGAVQ